MNELPAIEYLSVLCRKNTVIVRGQTVQVVRRKCVAKGCFDIQKKIFWREINHTFSLVVLSQMDLGNVDMWKM